MNFGTKILPDNKIEFNFWAPNSRTVYLCVKNPNVHLSFELPMKEKDKGWFQLITEHVKVGAEYSFRLDNGLLVPDPASRFQTKNVHEASVVINPDEFNWEEDDKFKTQPWHEAVIYELHTGTFTQEGSFNAIKEKLNYLTSLGVTAIELMPISAFPGKRNWGYDGVLPFAPDNTYGTPNDLKNLIKAAHQKGLMVFLDVVYNHFGPEGNYLHVYAKSKFFNSKEKTPWGDSINFKDKNVRDFFIQNALYWLKEYHFDGLRFDAIHAVKDSSNTHILEEIALAVRKNIKDRHVYLMLENDNNEAKYLKPNDYKAQWNDDFHHALHVLLTGEKSGYYGDFSDEKTPNKPVYYLARSLAEGFAYQGEKSAYRNKKSRGENSKSLLTTSFINFLQNHDQVGNRFLAERLNMLISQEAFKAAACIYLLSPSIPMLFMGEEFGCEQPFFFFCDFEETLARAVKEVRKKESSMFSNKNILTKVPDATSEEAFIDSKINWTKASTNKHREILKFYKKMLEIRKKHIIPIIPNLIHSETTFEIIGDNLFFVKWKGKNGEILTLLANLSNENYHCHCEEAQSANMSICSNNNIKQILRFAQNDKSLLIAETQENSFNLFKEQQIITNWGVYWFLDESNKKTKKQN